MIDTVILIVGFLCTGIIFSLCVIEYQLVPKQHVFFSTIRKYVHRGPSLHSIVLTLVIVSAVTSSLVSNQLNHQMEVAQRTGDLPAPNSAALTKPISQ